MAHYEDDDDANAKNDFITLDLTCRGGSCLTLPALIDVGDVPWDQTGEADVKLINPGSKEATVTLTVAGGDAAAEFALDGGTEVTVPAKGELSVTLRFDPIDVPGKRKGTLTVTDLGCDPAPKVVPIIAWAMPPGDEGEGDTTTTGGDTDPSVETDDDLGGTDATDAAEQDATGSDSGDGADTKNTSGTIAGYSGCGCRTAAPAGALPGGAAATVIGLLAFGFWRRRRAAGRT